MIDSTEFDKNEAEWRLGVFDALSFPTLILKPDRTILAANKIFLERNNIGDKNIIGRTCKDVFSEDQSIKHLACIGANCPLQRVLQSKQNQSVVHKNITADGDINWEERVFSPILGDNGEVKYVIESLRDITKIKHLEKSTVTSASLLTRFCKVRSVPSWLRIARVKSS
jgi:PAS domain S-box-containing protein